MNASCYESSFFVQILTQMDTLATSLYLDLGLRISNAVDRLSAAHDSRRSLSAVMSVMS
ncbi:hypothetical protein B0H10DRAFT_1814125 [Mycena sp. CBHHK59/15]|nr:hypothetical protein B0H10DRAFT_1814125 [Mycena sp. CBHHK59/15]